MAFTTVEICRVCNKKYNDTRSAMHVPDYTCQKCKNKAANDRRIEHFEMLDRMSIEQRLRRLETIEYTDSLDEPKLPYNPNDIYG